MAPEPADAGLVHVARRAALGVARHTAADVAPVHVGPLVGRRRDDAAMDALVCLGVVRRREPTGADERPEDADAQLELLRRLRRRRELPGAHVGEIRPHRLELPQSEPFDVEQQEVREEIQDAAGPGDPLRTLLTDTRGQTPDVLLDANLLLGTEARLPLHADATSVAGEDEHAVPVL